MKKRNTEIQNKYTSNNFYKSCPFHTTRFIYRLCIILKFQFLLFGGFWLKISIHHEGFKDFGASNFEQKIGPIGGLFGPTMISNSVFKTFRPEPLYPLTSEKGQSEVFKLHHHTSKLLLALWNV